MFSEYMNEQYAKIGENGEDNHRQPLYRGDHAVQLVNHHVAEAVVQKDLAYAS